MSSEDPVRLSDPASGAPGELSALFEAGARDLPSDAELARLSAKLGPLLAPPGGGAATGGSSALGAGKLAAVALALVGGAVLVTSLQEEVPSSVPAARTPLEAPQRPPADVKPEPALIAPAPPQDTASDSVVAPVNTPPRAERAPEPERGVEAEARLLEKARAQLGVNPSHALALTTEHKLRFPGGALAQEREVIAIEALRRLGKGDQASRRADEFSKSYPDSAHRHALDAGVTR